MKNIVDRMDFFQIVKSGIPAAVVDEHDAAVLAYLALGGESGDLLKEHGRGYGENLLLIVAGYNDI